MARLVWSRRLTVIPSDQRSTEPNATLTITQRDFGFALSHSVKPGRHTIQVEK